MLYNVQSTRGNGIRFAVLLAMLVVIVILSGESRSPPPDDQEVQSDRQDRRQPDGHFRSERAVIYLHRNYNGQGHYFEDSTTEYNLLREYTTYIAPDVFTTFPTTRRGRHRPPRGEDEISPSTPRATTSPPPAIDHQSSTGTTSPPPANDNHTLHRHYQSSTPSALPRFRSFSLYSIRAHALPRFRSSSQRPLRCS